MSQFAVSASVMAETAEVQPEVVLMRRLRDGDSSAMTQLIERFGPNLHRLIGRLTGWTADTDDILQEVFVAAWRKANTYKGTGSLEGWLRRLAVNRCKNHHRTRTAFARMLDALASRLTNRTIANNHEASSDLESALATLQRDDRMVLVLYYLEEMTGSQVADVMGIRVEAVHMRLSRARTKLRSAMLETDVPRDESKE